MSAPSATGPTYDPVFFDRLARIETGHAWFRTRNRVIAGLVAQLRPARMLDVGCGTGTVLAAIADECPGVSLAGLDLHPAAVAHARHRLERGGAVDLVVGDALRPPFGAVFDAVGMFDVLEHLPDDVAALRAQRAMVRPGGSLILTVPADPALWSYFDEAARHTRRYTGETLAAALAAAGFRVEYLSLMMVPLRPALAAYRRLSAGRARSGGAARAAMQDLRITPVADPLMGALLARERPRILRRERLAGGTSLIAIARPDGP